MKTRKRRHVGVEARRQRVFEAWAHGQRQYEIARTERVHQGQISRDISAVLAELNSDTPKEDRKQLLVEHLGFIAMLVSEALGGWHRSQQPRERRRAKNIRTPANGKKKGSIDREEGERVTEGRDGNPRFLERLQRLCELSARLHGLIVNKIAPVTPDGTKEYAGADATLAARIAGLQDLVKDFIRETGGSEGAAPRAGGPAVAPG
jgi:hypothetical protein